MTLEITTSEALWFLPFVVPVCLWVAWSDLRAMRIPNKAVMTLAVIFLIVGLIALPLAEYPWRLVNLVIVLLAGIVANAAGLMGAGDSKFLAAAAPFIDPGDVRAATHAVLGGRQPVGGDVATHPVELVAGRAQLVLELDRP